MAMKLADLMLEFERIAEELESRGIDPEDVEVRLAHQPRWAFEYSVEQAQLVDLNGVTARQREEFEEALEEMTTEERAEALRPDPDQPEAKFVVFLSEGSQLGYLPQIAAEALEWTR